MSRVRPSRRRGFSLIDLLALLALLVFLAGLLAPFLEMLRERAGLTTTRNNLKNVVLATHNCNDVYRRLPPMARSADQPAQIWQGDGTILVFLLPFIEQENLYRAWLGGNPATATITNPVPGDGRPVYSRVVPPYLSPDDTTHKDGVIEIGKGPPRWGAGNYGANYQVFGGGPTGWDSGLSIPKINNADGTSNTIFFATRYARCGDGGSAWAYPA